MDDTGSASSPVVDAIVNQMDDRFHKASSTKTSGSIDPLVSRHYALIVSGSRTGWLTYRVRPRSRLAAPRQAKPGPTRPDLALPCHTLAAPQHALKPPVAQPKIRSTTHAATKADVVGPQVQQTVVLPTRSLRLFGVSRHSFLASPRRVPCHLAPPSPRVNASPSSSCWTPGDDSLVPVQQPQLRSRVPGSTRHKRRPSTSHGRSSDGSR